MTQLARPSRIALKAISAVAVLVAVVSLAACDKSDTPSDLPISTLEPTAEGLVPVVEQRDFQINYRLEGLTGYSDTVPVDIAPGLEWLEPVATGTTVDRGDTLGTTVVTAAVAAQLGGAVGSNRIGAAQLEMLSQAAGPVVAPVSGVVISDSEGVRITNSGLDVQVGMTPLQHLRLRFEVLEAEATVETVVGQRTMPCESTWFEAAASPDAGADTQVTFHCRLPPTAETVAGIRAGVAVRTKTIPNATVVPNAMIGVDDSGYVVFVRVGESTQTVQVGVGPSDGVVRVITTPLVVGSELVSPPGYTQ